MCPTILSRPARVVVLPTGSALKLGGCIARRDRPDQRKKERSTPPQFLLLCFLQEPSILNREQTLAALNVVLGNLPAKSGERRRNGTACSSRLGSRSEQVEPPIG
jgi:hypothetical protein